MPIEKPKILTITKATVCLSLMVLPSRKGRVRERQTNKKRNKEASEKSDSCGCTT